MKTNSIATSRIAKLPLMVEQCRLELKTRLDV
jgi:hypothetical protein